MFNWTIMDAHSTFLFYSFCFIFIAHYECKIIKMKLDRHAYLMPSKLFVFPVWRLGQDVEFAFLFYFNPTMEIHWDDYGDHMNVPCNEPVRLVRRHTGKPHETHLSICVAHIVERTWVVAYRLHSV